jgi:hypothetical protein
VEIWSGDTRDATDVRLQSFKPFSNLPSRNQPTHVFAGDRNADGVADFVVAVQGTKGTAKGPRVFDLSSPTKKQLVEHKFELHYWVTAGIRVVDPLILQRFYGSSTRVATDLETRTITTPATNSARPADIDGDGKVTARDAALVSSALRQVSGTGQWVGSELPLPAGRTLRAGAIASGGNGFLDANGDGFLDAKDLFTVIRALQLASSVNGGEGEAASSQVRTAAFDAVFAQEDDLAFWRTP